ncbi:ABC transporter-like protein [Clohesyomyces aquaticus]|uniref:ABC transporter-like protein n=1 Tax=Clohesyomyces aquaticus TaxID=1231657 RepID=A0A1Y2A787_9PLEO|nr:ABC transporter-like protein [Clohesyomyces aquaticus]
MGNDNVVAQKLRAYKQSIQNFIRIFSYSTPLDKAWLIVAALSSAATGVTIPLMNIIFARLVRVFTNFYARFYTGWTPEQFRHEIAKNVLWMIYIFVARFVLDYVAVLGFRHTGLRISAALRLKYLRSLMSLPISSVDAIPQGHTAAIITITANVIQDGISEKLCLLIQNVSLIISAIVVAFIFSWLLAIVTVTGLVFVLLVYAITLVFLTKKWRLVEEADREGSGTASETISSIRMVAACGAESKMAAIYSKWVKQASRHGQKMGPWSALQSSLVFFAIYGTAALCFWWAIRLYMHQKIVSVETLLVVITSILTIVMCVGSISAPLSAVTRAAGAASTFYGIIDAPKAKTGTLKAPDVSATEDIVLNQVNFTYISRPQERVLHDVSITFPAGKTTAIVGPSGSGKSTIVSLIQRWYEVSIGEEENPILNLLCNGSITTGGRKLLDIDVKWWRSQIGLVQQEPFLFNGTIFENVCHGLIGTQWENETEEVKRVLVKEACEEAFADEFIARLPDGYETLCGDAGMHLSGGQRQRIAIARCIIKKPAIVILDEATSAIDVRSEQKVQAALDRAAQNRTTIVIAHRLSTIQKADNIIVLKKGVVIQQGPHDKLMKNRAGVYYKLANAQVLRQQEEEPKGMFDFASVASDITDFKFEQDWCSTEHSESSEYPGDDLAMAKTSGLRHALRTFGHLFIEQKRDWYWYLLIVIGAAGAGAAYPVQSYLFAQLISLFGFYGDYLRNETQFWCLMMVALAGGAFVAYLVLGWACNTVSFHIVSAYRDEYFQNLLKRPIAFFDDKDNSSGALTARIASDPAQLQQLLGVNAASMLTCIFNVAGCIAISFYFSWRLSVVVVFSSTPVMILAGYLRVRYERKFQKATWLVFTESSKFAIESIGAFRTVSALTMEDSICDRYETLLQKHIDDAFWSSIWSTLIFSFSDSVALLCMAFALWYGGDLLSKYELWPFNYLVVYLAIVQGSLAAGQWLSFGPNIAQASSALKRIRALRVADNADLLSSEELPVVDDEKKGDIKGPRIELRNVWFRYPTRDVPVLRGINMTIERGQFAAIVGPSGCGKTSIISLLERFYTPQSGTILFDNAPISTLSLPQYRSCLSLVAQEPSIIGGTIRANILMGVDPDSVDESDLDRVSKEAEMYEYISSFPITYNTLVGQRGVALSGGQRQRLSIARALIRDPRLMLLDEATSNLDSETERSIQKIFEKTGKGRTMIVVAHRLATIQNADVIFVMSEGRVVEQGNHRELLRKNGVYWQMCQLQALDK